MEQNLFATYERDRNVLKIYYDTISESPRELDNLGTMNCWHRRYSLGDEHSYGSPSDFWYALAEEIVGDSDKVENMTEERREKIVRDNVIILPLYLYDHGGITMRTYPYSCPWDSGQVGWIYVTKEKVRQEYGVKRISKKFTERVLQYLKSEVEIYDQYLTNDVYGFELETAEGEHIDSCWGFYGDNFIGNGMLDHIGKEWGELLQ